MRPLGRKAYGSIPHLPSSRAGSDKRIGPAQARRMTVEHGAGEEVVIQEKLDGSCVAVARHEGAILALGREGKLASASRNPARQLFAEWVAANESRFALADGERIAGEWLALAHGTRYSLPHEPFVAFDLLRGALRSPLDELVERTRRGGLVTPHLVHRGSALSVETALARLGSGGHGAVDPPEGLVYRLERGGRVLAVAKHVRVSKIDGALLPENTGGAAHWNWTPDR